MTFALSQRPLSLRFRDPFRIARSADDRAATTVVVELRSSRFDGLVGLGEGYPDAYYGETPETIATVLPLLLAAVEPLERELLAGDVDRACAALDAADEAMERTIRGHGGARCALDIALHDLAAKRCGIPVVELLGLSRELPPTDFTIGIDQPAVVAERARRAARFPALKIKLGGPADLATLEAVRAVYGGPIRVDANTGWTPEVAEALVPELVRLRVELIEQPFPQRRYDWLGALQAVSPLPIVADESAVTIDDLDALRGVVAGVNVKLAKVGGLGPARRMLERARSSGFRTFLGCMEETSIVIAASAAVASLADWVDLDGNLLIADDPYAGLELGPDCRWQLSAEPGLGVHARSA